jgi:hypothetical protein
MRVLLFICAGLWMSASTLSQGQSAPPAPSVRVRLLDYKTGRPLKGRYVQLTLSDPSGNYGPDAVLLKGKTGADGVVVFRPKAIPSPRVDVVTLDDMPCTAPEEFATDVIVQQGIVGTQADVPFCKPHTSPIPNPRPGEVVFYAHRLNLWQRFRRSIEE